MCQSPPDSHCATCSQAPGLAAVAAGAATVAPPAARPPASAAPANRVTVFCRILRRPPTRSRVVLLTQPRLGVPHRGDATRDATKCLLTTCWRCVRPVAYSFIPADHETITAWHPVNLVVVMSYLTPAPQMRLAVTRPIIRVPKRKGTRVKRLEYQAKVANASGVITTRRASIPRTARRAMVSDVRWVRESSIRAKSSVLWSSPDRESARPERKNWGQITEVVTPRGRSSASRVSPRATAAALVAL